MQYTDNYSLRKPQNAETAKVSDLNYNADQIDGIMADDRQISLAMYVSGNTYNTGDIVGYENPSTHRIRAYRCLADNVTGTWDSTKWTLTNLAAEIIDAKQSGGTEVIANPTGTAADTLNTVEIDDVIYDIGGDSANQNIADAFSELQTYAVGDYCIYESILYKCTTAVTTAGAWDSTKWTPCVVTDEMGGGGGGNEQELTYAQYLALTDAQRANGTNYFVTDINGDGSEFQPIIYSEDEREIGVWTDGKPLYQKTVNFTNTSADGSVPLGLANIDTIFVVNGQYNKNTPLPYLSANNIQYAIGGFFEGLTANTNVTWEIRRGSSGATTVTGFITVQYTKTTDTAGSGIWTPQGVPAVHYSESEHIVGTWIDGKTIYEKTIKFTATSSANTFAYVNHNISNLGTIWTDTGNSFITKNGNVTNMFPYNDVGNEEFRGGADTTRIFYRVGSTYTSGTAYVTLRYTKSA